VGYGIGFFLRPVGTWLLSLTGGNANQIGPLIQQWGPLLLAVPIPYKLLAITSGIFSQWIGFPLFFGASIVIRGIRFFSVAWLIRRYGAPMQAFVEKRLGLVVGAVALALVGVFLVLRFAV
jgi:membrane protein YqaA with SNARE-associated domain